MKTYPIIANCNYESRDDYEGQSIHAARKAVEAGLTDDAPLIDAMDALEATLTEHSEDGSTRAVGICEAAELAVVDAWNPELQHKVEAARQSQYIN